MTLESPETYGEWYWKHGLDAEKAFDESMEQAVSPLFAGLLADMPDLSEFSPGIQRFIKTIMEPPTAGLGRFLTSSAGEFTADILNEMLSPARKMMRRQSNRRSKETWLNAPQALQLKRRKQIDDSYFDLIMASEGYEDVIAEQVYKSTFPYPSIPDIMLYARYHGPPDNIRSIVWEHYDLQPELFDLWEFQTAQRLTTEQVQRLFKRGLLEETEFSTQLAQLGWDEQTRPYMKDLSYIYPNAMLLVQGLLLQEKQDDEILDIVKRADIHPEFAETYIDAILTKPAPADIIAYELRQDPDLSDLDKELKKIGIHPKYTDVYKTLAYPIPPVADLVTMAVREAFTPTIAARFGQYEDFPPEFQEWALKKGVSEEWAKRYWAAHWALPSPQQGFTMLHRGIIDETELNMLLRALDVMPFWRDKLTQVAYRPLTRVDVRRMYKEGILDEKGVYEAYLDHGYSKENATAMTNFTVQYVLSQQTKFTTRDVVSAYTQRMITSSTARSLLTMLGVRSENLSFILSTADYKKEWEFTEERIKGIKNLYKRKQYDENQAGDALRQLNIATEQVQVLMQQWWYEIKEEPTPTWTATQTLSFIKKELISEIRGRQELQKIGYDSEHVDVFIRSIK